MTCLKRFDGPSDEELILPFIEPNQSTTRTLGTQRCQKHTQNPLQQQSVALVAQPHLGPRQVDQVQLRRRDAARLVPGPQVHRNRKDGVRPAAAAVQLVLRDGPVGLAFEEQAQRVFFRRHSKRSQTWKTKLGPPKDYNGLQ